ncbi:unnamed protein product [Soboliphyme baturini]|uniref:DDE_Tnp_ISL3 domain-containing protein n=1 Tax=Soboliphyme baturini TaxID=241478 RepID=A0A183IQA3_9BILA|nr:unnamed protein product [Soboliphyme baturini]
MLTALHHPSKISKRREEILVEILQFKAENRHRRIPLAFDYIWQKSMNLEDWKKDVIISAFMKWVRAKRTIEKIIFLQVLRNSFM